MKESREAPHKGLYHGETYVFGYRTTWSKYFYENESSKGSKNSNLE